MRWALLLVTAFAWQASGLGVAQASERISMSDAKLSGELRDGVLVVQLRDATYELSAPLELSHLVEAAASAPIVIQGARDGSSRLTGSKSYRPRPVRPGEPLPERLARSSDLLVIDADDDIRRLWEERGELQLGCGRKSILTLYQGGKRLNCARWPKQGYGQAESIGKNVGGKISIRAPAAKTADWADVPGLTIAGYFGQDWFYDTGIVTSVAQNGTLGLSYLEPAYQPLQRVRYFVRGAAVDLTGPGEYISDPASGRIFLKGLDGDAAVEIPIAKNLILLTQLANVTFQDVHLSMAWGDAVVIRHSSGITIRDSRVEHAGGTGIEVEGGKGVLIERVVVDDVGENGIVLSGGDRATLTPAGHAVRGSVIRNTSVIARTYNPAVALKGVGNVVEDCLIADLPHVAISYAGNDHRIGYNEITAVARETSDAGAIYSGRDWTWRGTRIEGNFIHDVQPSPELSGQLDSKGVRYPMEVKGIYLDDMLSGTTIEANILANVEQPVFIGGGRDNTVSGNLFIKPGQQAVHLDARGLKDPDWTGALQKKLNAMPYQSPVYAQRYPGLADILSEDPGAPRGNVFDGNIVVDGAAYDFAGRAQEFVSIGTTVTLNGHEGVTQSPSKIADLLKSGSGEIAPATRDRLAAVIHRLEKNRIGWQGLQSEERSVSAPSGPAQ